MARGVWHLPEFVFVPGYNSAGSGVAGMAGMAASVLVFTAVGAVGQSVLLTWPFNHARQSALLVVLAHAPLNAGSGFVAAGRTASMAVIASFGIVGLVLALTTRGTGRSAHRHSVGPTGAVFSSAWARTGSLIAGAPGPADHVAISLG